MKCISLFLLCAATVFGQATGFTTGQAARLVIGQSTFTSQDSNSSDTILGGASGLAYAGDTLFVADANRVGAGPSNHRVLIYQGLSSMLPSPTAELVYNSKCPVCVGQATTVLGQPDFKTTTENIVATANGLRLPTAVASDGVHLVVADTNHNRVLIWNRIPATNNQAADVVVGQPNFTTATVPPGNTPTAKSMRGPQGVWILNGKLYVADTQNNRVLIYNSIPTSNGAAADVVLGQPNFTTFVEPDLTQQSTTASASTLLNPVSVSSDGQHLFVADLGYNRVLIWNSIPSSNAAPADVAVGQPNITSAIANNAFSVDPTDPLLKETPVLCTVSNGNDTNSNPTYPDKCNSTVNFPRFALAGGGRLFIADGGNDRVLVFNTIPTQSGAAADLIIGQIGGTVNQATDAADSLRTPMSLAWDGTNLYVSDSYNRRITVYSLAPTILPYQAVRNAASLDIIANGTIAIGGLINAGDIVTISIGTSLTATPAAYTYTVKSTDAYTDVVNGLVAAIKGSNSGAGDPNVLVTADLNTLEVVLTSRVVGDAGDDITIAATVSTNAQILATASNSNLTGGGDAAKIAPGTLVTISPTDGSVLASQTASADLTQVQLPTQLGGVEVYFNGIRAPLVSVSPTAVTAQVPWEVNDTTSINAYVRSVMSDGTIMTTTPVAVTIVPANPGIYAVPDTNPSLGLVVHGSSSAVGIVDIEGSITAGDIATVTVQDRTYNYTVQASDSGTTVRDNLVALVNQDPIVSAEPSGEFNRIVLRARVEGPAGNNITFGATQDAAATIIVTAFVNASNTLCCANVAGAPVTNDNPAVPGEFIIVRATGLGVPVLDDNNAPFIQTGTQYPANGPVTVPGSFVSAIAGGSTGDVISASLEPGSVGTYLVVIHLNSGILTNPNTPLTIAQDTFVSKVITFPVLNPAAPSQ